MTVNLNEKLEYFGPKSIILKKIFLVAIIYL